MSLLKRSCTAGTEPSVNEAFYTTFPAPSPQSEKKQWSSLNDIALYDDPKIENISSLLIQYLHLFYFLFIILLNQDKKYYL